MEQLFQRVCQLYSVCCLLKYSAGYTYPEFNRIDVTTPTASSDQRDKAREAVQKYYGLDPDDTEKKLMAVKLKLFQPPAFKGHKCFNYRVFITAVQLPEHAFNMPYTSGSITRNPEAKWNLSDRLLSLQGQTILPARVVPPAAITET